MSESALLADDILNRAKTAASLPLQWPLQEYTRQPLIARLLYEAISVSIYLTRPGNPGGLEILRSLSH